MPRRRRGAAASATALVGLLVAAGAGALAFHAAVRHTPLLVDADRVSRWARETTLGSGVVLVVGIVAGVVGLVLLLAAVLPPRRAVVELADDDEHVAAGLTPASLRRTVAAAALGVDGIGSAGVRGRRRVTVRATTSLRRTDGLADRVRTAVETRLVALGPARPLPVRVRLDRKDR